MSLKLSFAALSVASVLSLAAAANAATYTFQFTNEDGPVAGTVIGTLDLAGTDGTFAATAITITQAPAALGFTLDFDVSSNLTSVIENSFVVSGGVIDAVASSFSAYYTPDGFIGTAFALSGNAFYGSGLGAYMSASPYTGVIDNDNSTLTFSSVSAAVPVPATLPLVLSGIGALGLGALRKRKSA